MRNLLFAVWVLAVSTYTAVPKPQKSVSSADNLTVDKKVLEEIKQRNEILANLEYLSDMIGPRLTGTDNMDKASHWTKGKFEQYGLTNVHLEPWTIQHAWYRGSAQARIVSPAVHHLTIAAAGWSPSTNGLVHGSVLFVSARSEAELNAYRGKLNNKIVISSAPGAVEGLFEEPPQPETQPYIPFFANEPDRSRPGAMTFKFLEDEMRFFKDQGVTAVLRDSDKPGGLMNMTGVGGETFEIGPVPTAMTTHEDYLLIWRLLRRGPVEMEIELKNAFSEHPVTVYNTVAELPGVNRDEAVILGAHLDSWDLAEGTTDNGTGSMIVLEAARALKALGIQPKRTIRFVLFSGEEAGRVAGSRAYVTAHKAELDHIDAVLIHDNGSGRVLTLGLYGNYQDRLLIDRVLAPLNELRLGLIEPSLAVKFGSDHDPFNQVGIPGYWCIQDLYGYRRNHHSQIDTFDKVNGDNLIQGAQVMAGWAWNTAELPEMLPHKSISEEPKLPY